MRSLHVTVFPHYTNHFKLLLHCVYHCIVGSSCQLSQTSWGSLKVTRECKTEVGGEKRLQMDMRTVQVYQTGPYCMYDYPCITRFLLELRRVVKCYSVYWFSCKIESTDTPNFQCFTSKCSVTWEWLVVVCMKRLSKWLRVKNIISPYIQCVVGLGLCI